jgi:hypothetical protein
LIDVVAFGLDPSRGVKPGEYNIYNIDKLVQRVNKNVVILIDEAHEIDLSLNKSLKTLGDIENINLVLAGLPRLDEKIKKEGPALYERIVCKVELFNLSAEETRDLIVKRIENVGGWGHEPFTEDAVDEVYRLSDGNPRKIIKLCDCAVTSATSEGILTIDKNFLVESCEKKQSVVDEKTARLPSPTESTAPATAKVINVADGKPPELKSVIAERIRKLDKLYEEYLKTSDSGGMKEVLDIAQSTVEESRKRLKDESVSQKERERLTLVSDLFEEWIKKVGEKKVS